MRAFGLFKTQIYLTQFVSQHYIPSSLLLFLLCQTFFDLMNYFSYYDKIRSCSYDM